MTDVEFQIATSDNHKENALQPQFIHFANYSAEGTCVGNESVNLRSIDPHKVKELSASFARLSGDLDLPLEDLVHSDPETVLRISSNFHAAYCVYYVDSSACFASLILSGTNEESELELMQVFKYLLLDESDEEEPTDEEILELLNDSKYEFDQVQERPAVFQIRLSDEPSQDDVSQTVADLDQAVAVAFLTHPQVNAIVD